jgi:hypothetical protein
MVIVDGVIPGALAVRAAEAVPDPVVSDTAPVVGAAPDDLLELPQAVAAIARAPNNATALVSRYRIRAPLP